MVLCLYEKDTLKLILKVYVYDENSSQSSLLRALPIWSRGWSGCCWPGWWSCSCCWCRDCSFALAVPLGHLPDCDLLGHPRSYEGQLAPAPVHTQWQLLLLLQVNGGWCFGGFDLATWAFNSVWVVLREAVNGEPGLVLHSAALRPLTSLTPCASHTTEWTGIPVPSYA